jgi:hypothetical protein
MSGVENKKWIIAGIASAVIISGIGIIALNKSMENLFQSELDKELNKYKELGKAFISEKDIASLPAPVQQYFRYAGLIGKEKAHFAFIEWEEFFLKMDPEKDWTEMQCVQYNFVDEPARLAYMKTKIGGIIPFEGRDKYQDGHGNMLIKMIKLVTLGNSKGKEMDDAALVTILAEALFVPSYALQPYISWSPIDDHSAKATIRNGATEVSGIFHFDDSGACIRFDTSDRYFAEKDGSYTKTKWSAIIGKYIEKNGIRIPSEVSSVWHLDKGDYQYFKGKLADIKTNEQQR